MNRHALAVLGWLALLLAAGWMNTAQAAETVVYYHTDALRSVSVVTNATGQVLERTYYAPYGAVLNRPLRDGPGYTGHREDAETGLVYMQQRYYDPESGRFLSSDPVQADDKGGNFNRYWYANDNPYRYTDPDGRQIIGSLEDLQRRSSSSCQVNPSCRFAFAAAGQSNAQHTTQRQHALNTQAQPPAAQPAPEITYKRGVPPGSPEVHAMLLCTATCMGQTIRVTSTSEPTPVHGPHDVHTRGLAADVTTSNPGALMQCAANCGAVFQLNEYRNPSRNSTAGHVHIQLVPGRNGGTGPYYPQVPASASDPHPPQEEQHP